MVVIRGWDEVGKSGKQKALCCPLSHCGPGRRPWPPRETGAVSQS